MLISLNWLKKFADIPKGFTASDLASKLTMSTVEVEGVISQGKNLDGVVVGKVLEIDKHPNADKLKLALVDIGREQLKVVCGGINLKKDMLVAFAKVGTKVRWHGTGEPEELKPAKIRGVESAGMICASNEIGIESLVSCGEGEIADLSYLNIAPSTPLAEALGLNDAVLEVDHKALAHRPDLWGHYGLARELAAILKVKMADYEVQKIKAGRSAKLEVEIKDKEKCQRYIGVVIGNIKIGPSPEWLKGLLEAVGVRSINNIVDITNYIMLELGQPMHAFDWREIEGKKIIISVAVKGEKFTTLDGVARQLDEEMLLIRDAKKAVALAGVMGGQNSEIKDDTTAILFESANFKASNVRETSLKLALRSESSARFEKGLDPLLAETAMKKAVALVLEIIPGAKVLSKVVDENYYEFKALEIDLDLIWLDKFLGVAIAKEEVVDILQRLQFVVKEKKKGWLKVFAPSWRATGDVSWPEDLAEEIIRIYGYDNIKSEMPLTKMESPKFSQEGQVERQVKNILVNSLALAESYNYSFVDKNKVGDFGGAEKDFIALKNYLSSEQSLLRNSLIPGLVKNTADNLRFYGQLSLFELGRVFRKKDSEYVKRVGSEDKLPWQNKFLSAVVTAKNEAEPFFLAKGALESLFQNLNLDYYFQPSKNKLPAWVEPSRVLDVLVSGKVLGTIGEISSFIRDKFDILPAVGYFELDFTELAKLVSDNKQFKELPKYPAVLRDLAILIDQNISWEEVKKTVKKTGGELVKEIELFDIYQGDKIAPGERSLAFHLTYYSPEKTLTAEEVENTEKKIISELEKKLGAKIR